MRSFSFRSFSLNIYIYTWLGLAWYAAATFKVHSPAKYIIIIIMIIIDVHLCDLCFIAITRLYNTSIHCKCESPVGCCGIRRTGKLVLLFCAAF